MADYLKTDKEAEPQTQPPLIDDPFDPERELHTRELKWLMKNKNMRKYLKDKFKTSEN